MTASLINAGLQSLLEIYDVLAKASPHVSLIVYGLEAGDLEALKQHLSGQTTLRPIDVTSFHEVKAGEVYLVSAEYTFTFDGTCLTLDKTATRQAALVGSIALMEQEAMYRYLIEISRELICTHETNGTYRYVSPSSAQLLGYQPEELIGRDPYAFFHPGDIDRVIRETHNEALRGEDARNIQYRFRRKDGNYIWLDTYTEAVKDEAGTIVALVTGSRDVNDLKEVEIRLRESDMRFRGIADNVPGVVYLCLNDSSYSMLYLNQEVENLTGYPPEAFLNGQVSFVDLYHPDDSEAIIRKVDQALDQQKPFHLTYRLKNHRLGSWLWVDEYGQGIYEEGELKSIEGVLLDITERKRSEAKLELYTEKLEQLVEARTLELQYKNAELLKGNKELENALEGLKEAQANLIQAEKMASLGVLAAGVGHEINNPLNFIKNGSTGLMQELLRSPVYDAEAHQPFFDIINDGVDRASEIVKSLGHFSRQVEARDEQCPVHDIIDNCLVILRGQLKGRVEVIRQYHAGELVITGNEGRLHQAFLNILSNAEQAIGDEGKITITTMQHPGQVQVLFEDDGAGILPENLSRISDPFFTTKAPGQGTGLGLFITYGIIKELKGQITIQSEPKKGTRVNVIFPIDH